MRKNSILGCVATCVCAVLMTASAAEAQTIVMYASDAGKLNGNWTRVSDSSAAGGSRLETPNAGLPTFNTPTANPTNYAEFTFDAPAATTFHLWVRMRDPGNTLSNDSVYAQFSDAITTTGSTLYRIGTTSALQLKLQTCDCPVSGWGWNDRSWELSQNLTLRFSGSGTHTIRFQTREDGTQIDQVVLSSSTYLTAAPGPALNDNTIVAKAGAPAPPSGGSSTPFTGTALAVPGTIQAEAFDKGGSGVAFSDVTPTNEGNAYRPQEAVDLEPASGGGYNVGWTATGEWLVYSVNVASTGTYQLEARVAAEGAGGTIHIESNGTNLTGPMTLPTTGAWQTYTTISKSVSLTAGSQRLKLVFDSTGAYGPNIDWLRLTQQTTQPPPAPPSTSTIALPGSFAAEAFADGGEGVGYHDSTSGNSGGTGPRSTDVDIETCGCGGYNVGWTDAGEWLAYSVNVSAAGNYNITVRVAAPGSTGRLHFTSGSASTAVMNVPQTGGWQVWTSMTLPITLAAGPQTMKVVIDSPGINIAGITVAQVTSAPPPATEPPPAQPPPAQPPPPSSSGGSVTYVNAGADLQAAINAAAPGDTLMLAPGASYVGNFVLPVKSGSSYITIRSSASDTALPNDTTRITPASASNLPKLRSPNAASALVTAPGAHHYRIQFVEFQANYQGLYDIIQLGDGSRAQNSLSMVPHDLVLDRVYIHGDPTWGQKRAIGLNSASTTIINSYISEIKSPGQDSQGIAGWNGPGPFMISNNYIEAASENVLFGGSDPGISGLIPSDITFTRNYLTKQLAWRSQSNLTIKNLLELKNAQRVVINGNIMENNWMAAQSGYAILFTVRNQDGGAPWSIIQQVQFTNNIVRHVSSGINILATDYLAPSQTSHHITIRNNLFEDVSGATWGGSGRFLLINGGYDITVDHNTVIQDGASAVYADSTQSTNFVFTNNIVPDYSWAIMGAGTGPGNSTISTWFPGSTFLHNVFAGSNSGIYPPNNYFPANMGAVGFVNMAGGDYRLSSSSLYRARATDGTDVGCDITALNSATAGVK